MDPAVLDPTGMPGQRIGMHRHEET